MLSCYIIFFFFKQKTAYEMRISDWSSDVCSSDLPAARRRSRRQVLQRLVGHCVVPAPALRQAIDMGVVQDGEKIGAQVADIAGLLTPRQRAAEADRKSVV